MSKVEVWWEKECLMIGDYDPSGLHITETAESRAAVSERLAFYQRKLKENVND
jgi:hypothetical protein